MRKEHIKALLESGQRLSVHQLSNMLHVSERHIRRLIQQLREEGLPIQEERSGKKKRYFLPDTHLSMGEICLNLVEEELLALALAIRAASPILGPSPYGEPLNRVYQQLLNTARVTRAFLLEKDALTRHWHFFQPEQTRFDRDILLELQRAILEQRSVYIDYYAASTRRLTLHRKIDPLTIAFARGSWILAAYCHLRKSIRDFSLGGIRRIEHCDPQREEAYFRVPEGYDPELHFRDRFGLVADREVYVVRMRVREEVAPYFRRKVYHPTQQIEYEEENGALIVSYEVEGLDEIGAFVRSWGARVEVIEPEELRQQMYIHAQNLLQLYSS